MGKVITGGTMSLDGYIAGPEESGFDLLFQWYGNGDVVIPSASPDVPPPRISAARAELIKPEWENTGDHRRLCRRARVHSARWGSSGPANRRRLSDRTAVSRSSARCSPSTRRLAVAQRYMGAPTSRMLPSEPSPMTPRRWSLRAPQPCRTRAKLVRSLSDTTPLDSTSTP